MFGFKRSQENGESEKGGAWRVWLIPPRRAVRNPASGIRERTWKQETNNRRARRNRQFGTDSRRLSQRVGTGHPQTLRIGGRCWKRHGRADALGRFLGRLRHRGGTGRRRTVCHRRQRLERLGAETFPQRPRDRRHRNRLPRRHEFRRPTGADRPALGGVPRSDQPHLYNGSEKNRHIMPARRIL